MFERQDSGGRRSGIGSDVRLQCRDIAKSFGGVAAVVNCSLTLARGEILGLIGPNGAGKSTVLDVLAGRTSPDAGSILFDGKNVTRWRASERAADGIIRSFQLNSEFGGLTVLENVLVACQEHPGEGLFNALFRRRRWQHHERIQVGRARGLLEEFGLIGFEREYARTLSGGQKRLLELCRSVMANPQVLLLDEPTVGISPMLLSGLVEHLRRLAADGVSCLLVEHSLDIVSQLCDRVLVMAGGSVIAEGSFEEVVAEKAVKDAYLD